MTDKIQELEDAVFSHHFLQDHDKIEQSQTSELFKGVIEPNSKYCLDSIDVMGHRSPLYLRSLIEALAKPAQFRQSQAIEMLEATTKLLCDKMGIQRNDYPYISVSQSSQAHSQSMKEWRTPTSSHLNNLTSQKVVLDLPTQLSITLSKTPLNSTQTISALSLIYQQKITDLYREQKLFELRIPELMKQISEIFQVQTTGLFIELPEGFKHPSIHFYQSNDKDKTKHSKNLLLFPIAITTQQLKDIKNMIGDL